ncbi:unnamed protein product [Symbiodinium natans]|uniref:Uncharacterized protein n=1 Tax=Symbiodinium natans TaxID=878477 RepID=A0A812IQ76_9DINO|nr:unnamed protein product [Symbiodinium natans]
MAEHGGYGDVHVDDAWHSDHGLPYELPHVHISVEPPPAGSAPLTVETDHPMAPVAPPTPPLTEQAIKDSSAAGTEAADAAMQMGAMISKRLQRRCLAGFGLPVQLCASIIETCQAAADHARWSAGTSSTPPPLAPEHQGFEDATIETWPALFKAQGCHKVACGPIDGLFHEVGENEGHPMYAKDGEEDARVTLYFLNDDDIAKKGWWVGQFPGSGTTYAFNPSEDVLPPMVGWRVPWNSPLPEADLRFIKTAPWQRIIGHLALCPCVADSGLLPPCHHAPKQDEHPLDLDKASFAMLLRECETCKEPLCLTLQPPPSNHSHMPEEAGMNQSKC